MCQRSIVPIQRRIGAIFLLLSVFSNVARKVGLERFLVDRIISGNLLLHIPSARK